MLESQKFRLHAVKNAMETLREKKFLKLEVSTMHLLDFDAVSATQCHF